MVTIHCVSPLCLHRVLRPKNYVTELKAFCMDWAALPARSWGGGTNTAPDPQPRWTGIKKRLDLHPTAHKSLLSLASSHTKWLHRDLDWKNARCSVMVRIWRSDTERPPGTGTEAGVDLYPCNAQRSWMDLLVIVVSSGTRCRSWVCCGSSLSVSRELEFCLQNHPSVPSGDTITGLCQYGQYISTDY